MTGIGWLQIGLFSALVLAVTRPLGAYLFRVFEGDRQPLPKVFGPLERLTLKLCGVDAKREHRWTEYTLALLAFSLFGMLVTYGILRAQAILPLNPQHFA